MVNGVSVPLRPSQGPLPLFFTLDREDKKEVGSGTGNRTRACWVRASYPNH